MEYISTNIRLPRKTLEELKIRAAKKRTSLAQLIRDAVEQSYGIDAGSAGVDPRKDPFRGLIGAFDSGIADGAKPHDRDIYGERE